MPLETLKHARITVISLAVALVLTAALIFDTPTKQTDSTAPTIVPLTLASYVENQGVEVENTALFEQSFEEYKQKVIHPANILAFYNSEEERFNQLLARASHILIATSQDMSQEERQIKLSLAMDIYHQLKEGESFSQLATQYSDDRFSMDKNGDLGWLSKGKFSPQFDELVFEQLEVNEIAKPIQSKLGFHIVKLTQKPMQQKKPLEEVAPIIEEVLQMQLEEEKELLLSRQNRS